MSDAVELHKIIFETVNTGEICIPLSYDNKTFSTEKLTIRRSNCSWRVFSNNHKVTRTPHLFGAAPWLRAMKYLGAQVCVGHYRQGIVDRLGILINAWHSLAKTGTTTSKFCPKLVVTERFFCDPVISLLDYNFISFPNNAFSSRAHWS